MQFSMQGSAEKVIYHQLKWMFSTIKLCAYCTYNVTSGLQVHKLKIYVYLLSMGCCPIRVKMSSLIQGTGFQKNKLTCLGDSGSLLLCDYVINLSKAYRFKKKKNCKRYCIYCSVQFLKKIQFILDFIINFMHPLGQIPCGLS